MAGHRLGRLKIAGYLFLLAMSQWILASTSALHVIPGYENEQGKLVSNNKVF